MQWTKFQSHLLRELSQPIKINVNEPHICGTFTDKWHLGPVCSQCSRPRVLPVPETVVKVWSTHSGREEPHGTSMQLRPSIKRMGKYQGYQDGQNAGIYGWTDAEIRGIERCKRARMNSYRSLGPPAQKRNLASSLNCPNPSLRAATHHIKSSPHFLRALQTQKAQDTEGPAASASVCILCACQ